MIIKKCAQVNSLPFDPLEQLRASYRYKLAAVYSFCCIILIAGCRIHTYEYTQGAVKDMYLLVS